MLLKCDTSVDATKWHNMTIPKGNQTQTYACMNIDVIGCSMMSRS